jgi:hypothetical protein
MDGEDDPGSNTAGFTGGIFPFTFFRWLGLGLM